ncbi:PREDICTED: uncharacterized protein C3orf22 homolog [Bison bison bison]|uniref:Uncharacterized protein C3orf22 homolog n=1 Tax=Bison bison bison TaxID=43346 RepID=A0A6P3H8W4_BISBB|nr:PREDICTED: uncharacterized protein C3orf22 homolog [Bison bison bison]
MDPKAPKKSRQGKKSKARTQEKFARKFPYRNLWELALLTRRFPRLAAPPPTPRSPALHHQSLGPSAPRHS